jgi:hypothetical protein
MTVSATVNRMIKQGEHVDSAFDLKHAHSGDVGSGPAGHRRKRSTGINPGNASSELLNYQEGGTSLGSPRTIREYLNPNFGANMSTGDD